MGAATSIVCPACTFEQDSDTESCVRCGVVFAKIRTDAEPCRTPERAWAMPIDPPVARSTPYDGKEWKLLAVGFVAAAVMHSLPFFRFVLSPLVTLLHEFGHAVASWLLGCPALPAFDFVYGGGVTHHQSFQLPLGILLGAGWVWLGWTFRRNPRTLTLIGLCAGLWLVAISSEWRRGLVISAMGHGGELILAGVLLYMALSGKGWRAPEIERPLGAFAAFFVQLQTMQFAWKLRNDEAFLAWYRDGKGGAMMNDLEVIALDIKIWTGVSMGIEELAGWLLLFAVIPPTVAILLFVFRDRVRALARSFRLLRADRSY